METNSIGRATFGGLATGLDTNALLDGLLAIERQPLERLESRRAEIDRQRGLMRTLNTKLLALRDAARAIDNRTLTGSGVAFEEELLRYTGATTNEDVVAIEAGAGAVPGDFDIVVNQLATPSRRFSMSFADADDASLSPALQLGQSLTIELPNADPDAVPPVEATSITIEAGLQSLSLRDVRDQINTSADNGGTVRAEVLRISDDDHRLVITSTGTGASNELSITGDLALDLDPARVQAAQDAEFVVFGETITRESNLIDDVLTGVTLRLVGASEIDEDDPPNRVSERVTIATDNEEVADALGTFVNAYNDVMSFIDQQFEVDEVTNRAGPLSGDFTLRSVQGALRSLVSRGFQFTTNANNPFAPSGAGDSGGSIAGIGLIVEAGGRLRLDEDKLEEALARDAISVREFLSGRARTDPVDPDAEELDFWDDGFATAVAERLEQVVRFGDGALASRDQGYAQTIESLDASIERFESRLAKREETLLARFTELERIVAGLQSQQGFLGSL